MHILQFFILFIYLLMFNVNNSQSCVYLDNNQANLRQKILYLIFDQPNIPMKSVLGNFNVLKFAEPEAQQGSYHDSEDDNSYSSSENNNNNDFYQISSSYNEEVEGAPMQLIQQRKNGDLQINETALNLIKRVKNKVAVYVVVGPYRQGKSYILNRLLNRSSGFQVGHTDNSCTKGIWMWNEIVKHKNKKNEEMDLIYLDTEGIESDDSNAEWDTKIFLLSLLLSSMFCYNTKNSLTADSIKKLSVMSVLSDRVKMRSDDDSDLDKSECPDFIWIIRDYALQSTLKPKERLEKFLEEESTKNVKDRKKLNEINERNDVRDKMKSTFNTLDCFYLPCPVAEGTDGKTFEEALQTMDKIEWGKLREPFRNGMEELCKTIKERIRPKVINSVNINGQIFAAYIKELVETLNSNETIYLTESLMAGIKLAAYESLKSVQDKYLIEMNKLSLPISWSKFDDYEKKLFDAYNKELQESIIGNNQILTETLNNFATFRNQNLANYKEKNGRTIFDKNYDLAKSLWATKIDPKLSSKSFKYSHELRQFIDTIKREYDQNEYKTSKESEDAWKKWIDSVNLTIIEINIEQARKSDELAKELENKKRESEMKAAEEAKRLDAIKKENERLQSELERRSNASSYSGYSNHPSNSYQDLLSNFQAASLMDRLFVNTRTESVARTSLPVPKQRDYNDDDEDSDSSSSFDDPEQAKEYARLPKRRDGKPDQRYKVVQDYYNKYGEY